jgi:hypothetical protein
LTANASMASITSGSSTNSTPNSAGSSIATPDTPQATDQSLQQTHSIVTQRIEESIEAVTGETYR